MELRNHPFMLYRGISIWPPAWIEHSEVAISIRQVELECCFANNNRGGTNLMKIWFLILSLVDCIVCPTEKPSIHYSIEDAAMEIGRYKNIKQADLFEFDSTTRTIKRVPLPLDTEHR